MSFILTLRLDEASQDFFEKLRQAHFPPERNLIAAHLTLFHHLPESSDVLVTVGQAAKALQVFPVEVTGLRSLGRGVAYTLSSPVLLELHRLLVSSLEEYLIPQDRQRFMPHVVVQNKVSGEAARGLLHDLKCGFSPWTAHAHGLDLWQYLGGPWQHKFAFDFNPPNV